jgi:5-oxoprolinase (ATP-hydrolysing)
MSGTWDFWIDRGGTFTDVIGRDPDGRPPRQEAALGKSWRLSRCRRAGYPRPSRAGAGEPIPAGSIGEVRMGTTVATNALLERKGDRTLLVTTKGFRDALRIGYQARPDIFAKEIIKPEQLYERVVEVDERVLVDGCVERLPDEAERSATLLQAQADAGFRAVAIVFMHA